MTDQQKFSRTTRIDILPDFTGKPSTDDVQEGPQIKRLHLQQEAAPKGIGDQDFQALLQSSYDAALITDKQGTIVDTNLRATEFLRFSRAVLVGQSVGGIVSGWDAELLDTIHGTLQSDRFVLLQAYCTRRDGSVFPTEIAIMRLEMSAGDHLCFFIRDTTLRKEAENRLRVGANAIDNAAEGIAIADMQGVLTFANGATDAIWQLPPDATLVGVPLADLLADPDHVAGMLAVVEQRSHWNAEVPACRRGDELFYIRIAAAPNVDTDDELIGVVLSLTDITERKLTERRLHETMEELARSNADLQQFAYVVSHDLQEPLRKVVQFGEMLKTRTAGSLSEEAAGYVTRMQAAARRMGALIQGILALSRVATRAQGFEEVQLAETASGVVSDLEARLHETGGRVDIGELPAIEAEPTQMRQLIQNLIANALKFHQPDRAPVVKVYGRPAGPDDKQEETEMVRLVVEDNGIGFNARQAERIFGVFQRLHTRKEYDGTGIGLAICRRIAQRHGGEIRAESVAGNGARFIVTLPRRQAAEDGRKTNVP